MRYLTVVVVLALAACSGAPEPAESEAESSKSLMQPYKKKINKIEQKRIEQARERLNPLDDRSQRGSDGGDS